MAWAGYELSFFSLILESSYRRTRMPMVAAQNVFNGMAQLAGGLLGGNLQAREGRRATDNARRFLEKHRPKLEAFEQLAHRLDVPPATLALSWLIGRPGVTAPIIGPRTIRQLDDALRALEVTLPAETLAALEEIFPGPGGPAPEAYAW